MPACAESAFFLSALECVSGRRNLDSLFLGGGGRGDVIDAHGIRRTCGYYRELRFVLWKFARSYIVALPPTYASRDNSLRAYVYTY